MTSAKSAETKSIIVGILTSNPMKSTLIDLCNDFKNLVGYGIPFKQMGFESVEDYLRSIPDTVSMNGSGPFAEVYGVVKPNSAHINSMVVKQKINVKKTRRNRIKSVPQRNNYREINFSYKQLERSYPLRNYTVPEVPPNGIKFNCYQEVQATEKHQVSTKDIKPKCYQEVQTADKHQEVRSSDKPTEVNYKNQFNEIVSHEQIQIEHDLLPDQVLQHSYEERVSLKNENSDPIDEEKCIQFKQEFIGRVPKHVQENLQQLIVQFPDGIFCTLLPEEYKKMFKKRLKYEEYYYKSLIEMCSELSNIFQFVRAGTDDFLLYRKGTPMPSFSHSEEKGVLVEKEPITEHSALPTASSLDWSLIPVVIPSDVFRYGDNIPRNFPKTWRIGDYLDITVGEIYDISKFWAYLTFGPLPSLMKDLQIFFSCHRDRYLIPRILLREGLFCVTIYAKKYHRCIIIDLLPTKKHYVQILFVDYGTVDYVLSKDIWYLPKHFGSEPCQAIRARLSNIYPPYENDIWKIQAVNRFVDLIKNTALVAEIIDIDPEDYILDIYLADISNQNEIFYINDVLVEEGYALFTDQERKQSLVSPNPKVKYIHLFPEFDELEAGKGLTTADMNYVIKNEIPLHWYMHEYFNFLLPDEDIIQNDKNQEENNRFNMPQIGNHNLEKNNLHITFFGEYLQDEIKYLSESEDKLVTENEPPTPDKLATDSEPTTPKPKIKSCDDSENTIGESSEYWACNRKQIYLHGDSETSSFKNISSIVASTVSLSDNSCSLDFPRSDNASVAHNLNFNLKETLYNNSSPLNEKSTNPFLCDYKETNPFRIINPFVRDIEKTIIDRELRETLAKPSENGLQKIHNNLTPDPACSCKTPKQLNSDKPMNHPSSSLNNNANMNVRDNSYRQQGESVRRIRTPPGFSSSGTNFQNTAYVGYPTCNWYQNYIPNTSNNPYYSRYQFPQLNNLSLNQNQITIPTNPAQQYSPMFNVNFVPQLYPNESFFNLQSLQNALQNIFHTQSGPRF